MVLNIIKNTVLLFVLILISCGSKSEYKTANNHPILNQAQVNNEIVVGANQTENYLPFLKGKRVGIVANQTSVIFNHETNTMHHIVDSLIALQIEVKKVFAPEHGFRGSADAGEVVKDGVDIKAGIPIISLYGKNKKPSTEELKDLDVVIFDIQDVGIRFYTYISSLHYVMEACAEQNLPVLILDRPNPNARYIDGPVLELEHKSFVGMHPIPVVHGMTIGEYAKMINGEQWLANGIQCKLTIIPLQNYTHQSYYSLPIKPSPNLPNDTAINLYPSLCFFEGTNVSAGRGTELQFQIFGSPFLDQNFFNFEFTPVPNEGSKYPKHQDINCYGLDLSHNENLNNLNLEWLIEAYNATSKKDVFFNSYFTKLAGTTKLQEQIEQGYTSRDIRKTWLKDLESYKKMRSNYLMYD